MKNLILVSFAIFFSFNCLSQDNDKIIVQAEILRNSFKNISIIGMGDDIKLNHLEAFNFNGEKYHFNKRRSSIELWRNDQLLHRMGQGQRGDITDCQGKIIGKANVKKPNSWTTIETNRSISANSSKKSNSLNVTVNLPSYDEFELGLLLAYHQMEFLKAKKIAEESAFFIAF